MNKTKRVLSILSIVARPWLFVHGRLSIPSIVHLTEKAIKK